MGKKKKIGSKKLRHVTGGEGVGSIEEVEDMVKGNLVGEGDLGFVQGMGEEGADTETLKKDTGYFGTITTGDE